MARKTNPNPEHVDLGTAGSMRLFTRVGAKKEKIAINMAAVEVIEQDGPGHYFIQVNGVRHAIASSDTLEELAGVEAPAKGE